MFYHIFGPRGSGGYDYKSGGGFYRFLIVLISFMAVNVVIPAARRCLEAAGGAREKQNRKNVKSVFAGLCLVGSRWMLYMIILPDAQDKSRTRKLALYFWKHSLGVLYAL